MPTLKLNIKYGINTNSPFSAQDLRDKFLSGLPNNFNGASITDDTIEFYIQSAMQQLESYLGLKLSRQIITEKLDYYLDDWANYGAMKVTYPVVIPVALSGYLGQIKQVDYPNEWLSAKESSDGKSYSRTVRLMPTAGQLNYQNSFSLAFGSFSPQLNWWRANRNIPNYWQIKYITGFPNDIIPSDILQVIGMIAVIPILGIISDMYSGTQGLGFGVSSKSISLDGLSQSVSSFASGDKSIFGARVKQYVEQLYGTNGKPGLLEILKDSYSSILFTVA
jgi:hypothetical protein